MKGHTSCIIGIVGLPGAGKTTVAAYLVNKNFAHIVLSDFIREEIIARGMTDFTRTSYQAIGNSTREEYGGDVLAKRAVKKIRKGDLKNAVIDGIRNISEIDYLRKQKNFHLLGITANARLKFARLSARMHTDKQMNKSYADFIREEKREDSLGSKHSGLRVSESLKESDEIVRNNSTRKLLFAAIDKLLEKWKTKI